MGQKLFAVPVSALREIADGADLKAGEIGVTIKCRRRTLVTRKPPSDLAFECWRLKRCAGRSYGQIAQRLSKHLAPRSSTTVRVQTAKKNVAAVDRFLTTAENGRALRLSPAFEEWTKIGVDPNVLAIVPFPGYRADATFRDNMLDYRDHIRAKRR
jgi:hypothetical protein